MVFSWFKRRRRRKILATEFPPRWRTHLEGALEHYSRLDQQSLRRLEDITRILVAEKSWEGCGGLELDEQIKVVIAAQAATLLVGMDHDYYRNVDTILVYPAGYRIPTNAPMGVLAPEQRAVLGHAQLRGPVVLSWQSARAGGRDADDGRNLVYHEFAHKLDMLDGAVDGTPPLADRRALTRWIQVMTAAYERLQSDVKRGRRTVLDAYGATDVGEFFACATETFFEKGRQLQKDEPQMYTALRDFYGQDPASWPRA